VAAFRARGIDLVETNVITRLLAGYGTDGLERG
jgi:hypothetical protein